MPESLPVSVVMAVYNGLPFLNQAIESILAQTFTEFELIVIDDASTDGSSEVLAGYSDPRLITLKNEKNMGLTRSLNKGLAISQGCFIARHDADDISDPDRFRQQVIMLESEPKIGLIGTNYCVIDYQNHILDTVQYPCTNEELQSLLLKGNCFCHGSVMFRSSCIQKVGGYREEFSVTQDYDLWLRIAESFELANLPGLLYQFRFHLNTISQIKNELQLSYDRLARIFAGQRRANGHEGKIPENILSACPPEPQRILDKALVSAYYLYSSGDIPKAKSVLQSAESILSDKIVKFASWGQWTFENARHLAGLHNQAEDGARFIKWVYLNLSLPNGNKLYRLTLANFYADQAFLAFQIKKNKEVIRNALMACINDVHWINNRGLLEDIDKVNYADSRPSDLLHSEHS